MLFKTVICISAWALGARRNARGARKAMTSFNKATSQAAFALNVTPNTRYAAGFFP